MACSSAEAGPTGNGGTAGRTRAPVAPAATAAVRLQAAECFPTYLTELENTKQSQSVAPSYRIDKMLGKHVSGHSFSMAVDQRVISSFKLVARPRDLNFMGATNVAKGLFNFAGTHDLLCRFVVLKNGWHDFLALQDVLEEVQHREHKIFERNGQSNYLCLGRRQALASLLFANRADGIERIRAKQYQEGTRSALLILVVGSPIRINKLNKLQFIPRITYETVLPVIKMRINILHESMQLLRMALGPFMEAFSEALNGAKEVKPCQSAGVERGHAHGCCIAIELTFYRVKSGARLRRLSYFYPPRQHVVLRGLLVYAGFW